MKVLIQLLVLLSPFTLLAAPNLIPAGEYTYSDFSVQVKKRYEAVYASTTAGQLRLQELREKKYVCEKKGNETFLCSAFLSIKGSENEIANKVEKELSNRPLEVFESKGEAELISDSPALMEWKIPQMVRFNGEEYESYRFLQTAHQEKIFFGEPAVETFVIDEKGSLNYSMQILFSETKFSYLKYFVLARYRQ